MARRLATAMSARDCSIALWKLGALMATMTPTITMTTISSVSVKPRRGLQRSALGRGVGIAVSYFI